jgi:hypothetical protein
VLLLPVAEHLVNVLDVTVTLPLPDAKIAPPELIAEHSVNVLDVTVTLLLMAKIAPPKVLLPF